MGGGGGGLQSPLALTGALLGQVVRQLVVDGRRTYLRDAKKESSCVGVCTTAIRTTAPLPLPRPHKWRSVPPFRRRYEGHASCRLFSNGAISS